MSTSKPEAGQWWFSNDGSERCYIHGISSQGTPIYELDQRYVATSRMWEGWHHEPRCTGWDWLVPEQPQPAEDPDEWVIQDRVPVRVGIDMISWHGDVPHEYMIPPTKDGASSGKLHGVAHPWNANEKLRVWCRRRDLPKVEQAVVHYDPIDDHAKLVKKPEPQPQKTRVRLFRSLIDGLVVAESECPDSDWQEIHHDSEGFYVVEGGQS